MISYLKSNIKTGNCLNIKDQPFFSHIRGNWNRYLSNTKLLPLVGSQLFIRGITFIKSNSSINATSNYTLYVYCKFRFAENDSSEFDINSKNKCYFNNYFRNTFLLNKAKIS